MIVHFVYYPFPSARVASADTAPEHPLPSFPSLLPPEPRGACRETRARSQDDGAGGGAAFRPPVFSIGWRRSATQPKVGRAADPTSPRSDPALPWTDARRVAVRAPVVAAAFRRARLWRRAAPRAGIRHRAPLRAERQPTLSSVMRRYGGAHRWR